MAELEISDTNKLWDPFSQLTIETKCWEGDWKKLLLGGVLEARFRRFNNVMSKTLVVNNVRDVEDVLASAAHLLDAGILSSVVSVEQYHQHALAMSCLTAEDLGDGYVYSMSELVGIYCCETPFLLHLAGDVMIDQGDLCWVPTAIELMRSNWQVAVANPLWNGRTGEAATESTFEDERFWYGQGFSDQCYLIEVDRFQRPIYRHHHPDSARYPVYGGELFEKRVDAWMRRERLLRATSKDASYKHPTYEVV
jgi:hypothetical protein